MQIENFKESVEKAIQSAPSLIDAMESVGAMYGIPSENIIVDDRLNGIRVQGDTILVPDRTNPTLNTKSIVCAIGAVLDNISQRIDQKLDQYQSNQIRQNKLAMTSKTPDPSKGDVVGRYLDDNGSEIIVYASGLVDMDNTPEASRKVAELRSTGKIPDYVAEPDKSSVKSSTYFTDEENDISQNLPSQHDMQLNLDTATQDLSRQINESAQMIDLYDEFHGSRTLGYDLLRAQGFDYVKPTHAMIQESDESKDDAVSDLQHMRFDNTKILDAIKLFNEAFDKVSQDVENPLDISVQKLMESNEWKDGVVALQKQFDCRLRINYSPDKNVNMYTTIDPTVNRPKLIISKSKGFQLSKMRIDITILGDMIKSFIRERDKMLFGQSMIAVFLHEIFHNITQMLRQYDADFIATMSSTMMIATSTRSVKARRVIFENYAKNITSMDGKKLSLFARKKMVRHLLYVSAIQYDAQKIESLKKQITSGEDTPDIIDKYINELEKTMDKTKKVLEKNSTTSGKVINTLLVILSIVGLPLTVFGLNPFYLLYGARAYGLTTEEHAKYMKQYLENPNKEEYYCDLFAGIYNLPVSFFLGDIVKGKLAKDVDDEKLQKLTKLEKEIAQTFFSTYPTDEERCYASVRIAKNALEQNPDMDESLKKYLQWIIDNYKNLENVGIKEDYNSGAYNPEEAENLDEHIQRIIDNGTVTVTESATTSLSKSRFSRFMSH